MKNARQKVFTTEEEYRQHLERLIQREYKTRAAFCRQAGISTSAASYFFAANRKMRHVENKILVALHLKKRIISTISLF